jgi:small nuclear ribonucleoprotein (snRNP)-like protein
VGMTVKIISKKRDPRDVLIKLSDGSFIRGKVNLYHDEVALQRVSEIFTRVQDPFVVVFEATVEGKTGRTCVINKGNILWVSPEEEQP